MDFIALVESLDVGHLVLGGGLVLALLLAGYGYETGQRHRRRLHEQSRVNSPARQDFFAAVMDLLTEITLQRKPGHGVHTTPSQRQELTSYNVEILLHGSKYTLSAWSKLSEILTDTEVLKTLAPKKVLTAMVNFVMTVRHDAGYEDSGVNQKLVLPLLTTEQVSKLQCPTAEMCGEKAYKIESIATGEVTAA